MTRLAVEAAFGYTITDAASVWTDITRHANIRAGLRITRGASDELSDIQPGTLTLTLDNSDGRFTPGRSSSPYYPNVKKNTPIRVRVVTTAKNLITNPGFETNSAGWTAFGNPAPQFARNTLLAHSGTASGLINWFVGTGTPGVQTVVYGLDVGQTYTASAWVWVDPAGPAVRLGLASGPAGSASTVKGSWRQITLSFTATSTSDTLQLTPTTAPSSDGPGVWIDDVQVEEGGVVTSFDADGARLHPRFFGMVNEWPVQWEGLYSSVTVTCTDVFKWLGRRPMAPMLSEDVLDAGALAYWPMSEPELSTSAGDLVGAGASSLSVVQLGSGGSLVFDEGDGPAASGTRCPLFTPASLTSGKYLAGDCGPAFEAATADSDLLIEVWFSYTDTTNARTLLYLVSDDGANVLTIESNPAAAGGGLTISGTLGGADWTVSPPVTNLGDGRLHHLVYSDNVDLLWIDGADTGYRSTLAEEPRLRRILVGSNGSGKLWSGRIAHVALYANDALTTATIGAHYAAGATGHAGETSTARAARLAGYANLTVSTSGSFGPIAGQGAGASNLLQALRDVESTESGTLAASRADASLLLQSRTVRYNAVPVLSLAYADLDTGGVEIADDDQKLINTIVAQRPGGATQRIVNPASVAAYGPYEQSMDVLAATDSGVVDVANWILGSHADPPPELREIPVEAYTLGLTTYRSLLDADISTPLEIIGLPAQAHTSSAVVVVEGYTETISNRQHLLAFRVSRGDASAVWVLDHATYSVLGSTTRPAY